MESTFRLLKFPTSTLVSTGVLAIVRQIEAMTPGAAEQYLGDIARSVLAALTDGTCAHGYQVSSTVAVYASGPRRTFWRTLSGTYERTRVYSLADVLALANKKLEGRAPASEPVRLVLGERSKYSTDLACFIQQGRYRVEFIGSLPPAITAEFQELASTDGTEDDSLAPIEWT